VEQITIEKAKLLIVEGKDEGNFFQALLADMGIGEIQILPGGGKTFLRAYLKAVKSTPGFDRVTSLGICRDADENAHAAFQSVRDALTGAGLPSPTSLGQAIGSSPCVTIELLPDGLSPGMLEDLCLKSVTTAPIMGCVHQYFTCVQGAAGTALPQNNAKTKAHAFLAMQETPGKRVGEAALSGYWPFTDPAFNRIKGFLRML
jgi:uncharacterized protein DUF3226